MGSTKCYCCWWTTVLWIYILPPHVSIKAKIIYLPKLLFYRFLISTKLFSFFYHFWFQKITFLFIEYQFFLYFFINFHSLVVSVSASGSRDWGIKPHLSQIKDFKIVMGSCYLPVMVVLLLTESSNLSVSGHTNFISTLHIFILKSI